MAYILNIETATEICSVAVSENNLLLALCESTEPNQHSSQLTLLIEEALGKAGLKINQLDAVALSSGPGSYTSLRVGSSVAKGICYALNIPLIAVDTLECLVEGALLLENDSDAIYCPMIDARRMEVYTALYDHQKNRLRELDSRIFDEVFRDELLTLNKKIIFSGNGSEKCSEIFDENKFAFYKTVCNSSNMLNTVYQKFINFEFSDIAYFSPTYLKAPNITTAKKVL
jgi:tRNA threonylcarbamoyladenosine biosynthesis protein TsaB